MVLQLPREACIREGSCGALMNLGKLRRSGTPQVVIGDLDLDLNMGNPRGSSCLDHTCLFGNPKEAAQFKGPPRGSFVGKQPGSGFGGNTLWNPPKAFGSAIRS